MAVNVLNESSELLKSVAVVAEEEEEEEEEEEKSAKLPTRATCPTGTGFWQVGKFQPVPIPTATRTRNLYGLHNL